MRELVGQFGRFNAQIGAAEDRLKRPHRSLLLRHVLGFVGIGQAHALLENLSERADNEHKPRQR